MGISADPLSPTDIRPSVAAAVQRGGRQVWRVDDLSWEQLDANRLTETDRSVVQYITYIEDHLPGYLNWLMQRFPTDGSGEDLESFCANREYFRFFVAWAYDEERHAEALTRYQLRSGMQPDETELVLELAREGAKPFSLPYRHPVEIFTYTLIQEKATQLFYQRFRSTVTEPVLRQMLQLMARDEARHFSLYCHLVLKYLEREGSAVIPHLRDVVATFRMPLANTLSRYRQWSFQVADAIGYDHTEAYTALFRLVTDFAERSGLPDRDAVAELVAGCARLP